MQLTWKHAMISVLVVWYMEDKNIIAVSKIFSYLFGGPDHNSQNWRKWTQHGINPLPPKKRLSFLFLWVVRTMYKSIIKIRFCLSRLVIAAAAALLAASSSSFEYRSFAMCWEPMEPRKSMWSHALRAAWTKAARWRKASKW